MLYDNFEEDLKSIGKKVDATSMVAFWETAQNISDLLGDYTVSDYSNYLERNGIFGLEKGLDTGEAEADL